MRTFTKLLFVQAKLYLREPMAVFFTLLFGPALLVMMGLIFGNEPMPELGGIGQMDISVPAYTGIILCMTGLTTIPINNTTRRDKGVLRRFSVTPLRPLVYFLTDVLVPFMLTLVSISLMFVIGMVLFDVGLPDKWLAVILVLLVGAVTFFSVGYALAGIFPSAQTATVVGNVVLIPLMFFSGAFYPQELMPEMMQKISRISPLTSFVNLLKGLWFGKSLGDYGFELFVLFVFLAAGIIVIKKTFRWE